MKQQPEYQLQCQIAEYLRRQYPRVMFLSDVRASLKLTIPQQVRSKKVQADGFACPDLMIFAVSSGWHGLFLELKAETPFKKDGTLFKSEHLASQQETIDRLREAGYCAGFCWDFGMAKVAIDTYLKYATQKQKDALAALLIREPGKDSFTPNQVKGAIG